MQDDTHNIPNYLHISDPDLLWCEFPHIAINFITRFLWHFEINLCQLLLEGFLCSTQKMHISEYACKICLKELAILLKCRETFEKIFAAYNASKNTGLPHIFFLGFWQLYFKNINFLTKTKRCLWCWLLWIQN